MSGAQKPTGKMSWFDYAFGVASQAAKKTWGEMRSEYQAGREGSPSLKEQAARAPVARSRPAGPPWWEVLHLPKGATLAQATAAYRELIRQNHPDKVAQLSARIRGVAEEETRRINAAYAEAQRQIGRR